MGLFEPLTFKVRECLLTGRTHDFDLISSQHSHDIKHSLTLMPNSRVKLSDAASDFDA